MMSSYIQAPPNTICRVWKNGTVTYGTIIEIDDSTYPVIVVWKPTGYSKPRRTPVSLVEIKQWASMEKE